MQYVNDDMDELFRRAAKDYPLNTGGADWEKVQKALEEPPTGEGRPAGKDNRRHLLWLLLLLPLPWICTRFSGKDGLGTTEAPPVQQRIDTKGENPSPVETGVPAGKINRMLSRQTPAEATERTFAFPEAPVSFKQSSGVIKSDAAVATPRQRSAALSRLEQANEGTEIAMEDREKSESATQETKGQTMLQKSEVPETTAEEQKEAPVAATDTANTVAAQPPAKKPTEATKPKRFYAGVIGGVDMTSVEMQKVKKVGYDLGIVVGYAINKKWTVEAGLLSSEKAYYSTGEHLYKAYLLPGTELREAEGDCRMWEVPLVARYRFTPEKKGSWTVSAGGSSYFMKKESYDYTYYYIATGQEEKRSRSYASESRHLFAAAQLSGGYSRRVGKTLEWRVEPYLKLPLRKVGYYELPLTSFGVHAGVTKQLR